jgi:hypothetical protein
VTEKGRYNAEEISRKDSRGKDRHPNRRKVGAIREIAADVDCPRPRRFRGDLRACASILGGDGRFRDARSENNPLGLFSYRHSGELVLSFPWLRSDKRTSQARIVASN